MKFRLTYVGSVKSSGNKPKPDNKHELRLAFHMQLSRLWNISPILVEFAQASSPSLERAITPDFAATFEEGLSVPKPKEYPYSQLLVDKHKKYGVDWHPLVTTESNLVCELSILMLRSNDKKSIVHGGDIDGRIKTIFDSLSTPTNGDVLDRYPKHSGFFTHFCLMIL